MDMYDRRRKGVVSIDSVPPLQVAGVPRGLGLLLSQMLGLDPTGRPTMAAVAAAMASYGAGDGRRRAARLTALALGSTLLLFGLAIGNGLIHPTLAQQRPAVEWSVTSEPSGAQVFDEGGTRLGLTPFTYHPEASRREPLRLRIEREGQPSREVSFDAPPSQSQRYHVQLEPAR